MRILSCLTLLVVLAPLSAFAENPASLPRDTLAEVGSKIISTSDLRERIELMPWPGKEKPTERDSAKTKALLSVMAEQLLAMEASALGMGTDTLGAIRQKSLERLMVKDELYKREVQSRVTVSRKEIADGMERYARRLSVLMFNLTSRDEAAQLSKALSENANIDSTLRAYPTSGILQHGVTTISYGAVEQAIEDAAYALTESRPVSPPFQSAYLGWTVLCLRESETNPDFIKRSIPERSLAVQQIVRLKKEADHAFTYSSWILGRQKAEANPPVFELLASTLHSLMVKDTVPGKNGGYTLAPAHLNGAAILLRNHLGDEFMKMTGAGMSLGDVLEALGMMELVFPSLQERPFRRRLNQGIKDVAAGELMAQEGYRQNLHHTEKVRHDVAVWTNYWLSQELEAKVLESVSVTDDEVLASLVGHAGDYGSLYEVNVREILADNLRESLLILDSLDQGADMAELARTQSRRPVWATRGGESGFFRVSAYPQLGFAALMQDTSKVGGPLHLREGFSVFRVLGKRHAANQDTIAFDSLRASARLLFEREKRQQTMNRFVASIARKYRLKINYTQLEKVEVVPVNMFTKRLVGFGGVMVAVPMLHPEWQWIGEMENAWHILP